VPSLFRDRSSWPRTPVVDSDGDKNCLAETTGRDFAFIPAKAGNLIVWDWRLPPGNSKNLSTRPRLASMSRCTRTPTPRCTTPRSSPGAAVAVFPGATVELRPHRALVAGAVGRIGSASYWP
jgi:hypothetical protein